MTKRIIAISFSGLVVALKGGDVTWEDIEAPNTLFFFTSWRSNVFDLPPDEVGGLAQLERGSIIKSQAFAGFDNPGQVHERLKGAFRQAEAEGRLVWRAEGHNVHTQGGFLDLLNRHGLQLDRLAYLTALQRQGGWHGNASESHEFSADGYQDYAKALAETLPEVRVIYH